VFPQSNELLHAYALTRRSGSGCLLLASHEQHDRSDDHPEKERENVDVDDIEEQNDRQYDSEPAQPPRQDARLKLTMHVAMTTRNPAKPTPNSRSIQAICGRTLTKSVSLTGAPRKATA
jgi:hypothetical protein